MKSLLLYIVLTFCCILLNAQSGFKPWIENQKIASTLQPNPDAYQITKYGGIPINNSTGSPNISIPIYTVKTANLQLPLSMNYTSSGFKPAEQSGRYGLSWSLSGIGVVNRTTNDAVDATSVRYDIPPALISGSMNDDVFSYLRINSVKSELYDAIDSEYDIHHFNFFGYSGKFILKAAEEDTIFSSNYGLKPITDLVEGKGFIDQQGIKYFFGKSDSLGTSTRGQNCGKGRYIMKPQSWYLTKVLHPNGDFLKFEYDIIHSQYLINISESITKFYKYTYLQCFVNRQIEIPGDPLPYPSDEHSICNTYNLSYDQVLKKISTSQGITVDFNYIPRQDVLNDKLLKSIVVRDTVMGTVLNKVNFDYHSAGTDLMEVDDYGNRLNIRNYLTAIKFANAADSVLNKYSFNYTSFENISRSSKSLDHWGYYNGKNNTTLVYLYDLKENSLQHFNSKMSGLANRRIDPAFSGKSLLNKVSYPTGGRDSIVYETNQYFYNFQGRYNERDTTIYINSVDSLLSPAHLTTFGPQTFNAKIQSNFVRIGGYLEYLGAYIPGVHKLSVVFHKNGLYHSAHEFELDENGLVINGIEVDIDENLEVRMQVGGSGVRASIGITYELYDEGELMENRPAPGVRVKSIHTLDPLTNTGKSLYYFYKNLTTGFSSASQMNPPDFTNKTRSADVFLCDELDFLVVGVPPTISVRSFATFSSEPNNSINYYNGLFSLYYDVIVANDSLMRNGYTRLSYLNVFDELPHLPYGGLRFTTRLGSFSDIQGILTKEETYARIADTLKLMQSVKNNYLSDTRYYHEYDNIVAKMNYRPIEPIFQPYNTMLEQNDILNYIYKHFSVEHYKTYKRWYRLASSETTILDVISSDTLKIKDTSIHSNLYNISPDISYRNTSTDEVLGNKSIVSEDLFGYSNLPAWLLAHKQNLYSQLPVQSVSIKKVGSLEYVTGGELYEYDAVLPWNVSKKYILQISSPILLDSFVSVYVQSNQLKFDSRFKLEETYHYSALQGNKLVGVETSAGYKETLIWGYNYIYPVARIMNVLPSEVSALLNYSILSSNDSYAIYSHLLTVKTSLAADAFMDIYLYERFKGIKDHYTYNNLHNQYEYDEFNRLSVVKDKDGNVIQKYCYLLNGQQENCTNVGYYYNTAITKNYQKYNCPVGAVSSTVSYSLPAGILYSSVSQADADAKAISYIDSVGQIYANNNAVCTFYNDAITQSFTKICSTGFVGSTHSYTIVAGTYSSIVSKIDANNIAQSNMNTLGQAHANNIGTCTVICTTANCSGEGRKCINGVCVYGAFVLGECQYNAIIRKWVEYYYYRFSDNSVSEMYYREVDECIWDN